MCTVLAMAWISPSDWWGVADFGNVPDWIAAVGTSAAFIVAAVAFLHEVRNRRAAQARLVFGEIAGGGNVYPGDHVLAWPSSEGFAWPQGLDAVDGTDKVGNATIVSNSPLAVTKVSVTNGSAEIVGPVLVRVEGTGIGSRDMALVARIVGPASHATVEVEALWLNAPEAPLRNVVIAFRDSSATWWTRRDSEPVMRATKRESTEFAARAKATIAALG